jgi:hypothetical protein
LPSLWEEARERLRVRTSLRRKDGYIMSKKTF